MLFSLAFLREPVVDLYVVREPARPEHAVVEVRRLDDRRRIPVRIQYASITLAGHCAVDPHRADEDQALESRGVHRLDDRFRLPLHIAAKVRVAHGGHFPTRAARCAG